MNYTGSFKVGPTPVLLWTHFVLSPRLPVMTSFSRHDLPRAVEGDKEGQSMQNKMSGSERTLKRRFGTVEKPSDDEINSSVGSSGTEKALRLQFDYNRSFTVPAEDISSVSVKVVTTISLAFLIVNECHRMK